MTDQKTLDIAVFGASGYTGRLVCEYLARQYPGGEVRWAMAGRSLDKLAAVRAEMGIPESVPLIEVDSENPASVAAMVGDSRVVITTVGPYQLYGTELVKQCAALGTDYVDLCGEPGWMHDMIAACDDAAKASGARIVFSCGFDSIPFDLGVLHLQAHAKAKTGAPASRVKGRVRAMNGSFSGGTVASLKATMAAVTQRPELIGVLTNPFSLSNGFEGPAQPAGDKPRYDEELHSWSAPFIMATINTKNIHRSNALMGHPYGTDFAYDEMLLTGDGDQGKAAAEYVAKDNSFAENPLQPGEGPSKQEREAGSYDILFAATTDDGTLLSTSVSGDMDPGYGSTSKMLAEAAMCLLRNPDLAGGGIWTPAAALGEALIERLEANAGIRFKVETPA
jgi:short subunit dehydrogenase-like uncharacterized protein